MAMDLFSWLYCLTQCGSWTYSACNALDLKIISWNLVSRCLMKPNLQYVAQESCILKVNWESQMLISGYFLLLNLQGCTWHATCAVCILTFKSQTTCVCDLKGLSLAVSEEKSICLFFESRCISGRMFIVNWQEIHWMAFIFTKQLQVVISPCFGVY